MTDQQVRFSIVIPTRGRPRQLRACLESVARLSYPREAFEVIVVNDGGQPPFGDLVEETRARVDAHFLDQRHAGPAAARNTGAARARGRHLVFTDDDCHPESEWLAALERAFAEQPGAAVGGRIVNVLRSNIYSAASQALIDYLYEYYGDAQRPTRFFTSNNLALPAERFREIGGFDTSFRLAAAEDREFSERWTARGWPMVYAPDAVVGHAHRLTFRKFLRQHFNYGRGAVDLQVARQRKHDDGVHIEPPSFYANLVRYPMARKLEGPTPVMSGLLLLSQVAYATGYYTERAKRGTVDHK